MARVVLGGRGGPRLVLDGPAEAGLAFPVPAEDPPAAVDLLTDAVLTVRRRLRTGWDDAGNGVYSWSDVVTGPVLGSESRTEADPVSGVARWTAQVTIGYSGPALENPTAEVIDQAGRRWQVTRLEQLPGRLRLRLSRVEAEPTVEENAQ